MNIFLKHKYFVKKYAFIKHIVCKRYAQKWLGFVSGNAVINKSNKSDFSNMSYWRQLDSQAYKVQ